MIHAGGVSSGRLVLDEEVRESIDLLWCMQDDPLRWLGCRGVEARDAFVANDIHL